MTELEDKIDKVLGHLVSLTDTIREQMVTKDEFNEFKSGIYSHIDGFIKLHETLDTEVASLRNKYDCLEERLKSL